MYIFVFFQWQGLQYRMGHPVDNVQSMVDCSYNALTFMGFFHGL